MFDSIQLLIQLNNGGSSSAFESGFRTFAVKLKRLLFLQVSYLMMLLYNEAEPGSVGLDL